jgi:hypothetical protein
MANQITNARNYSYHLCKNQLKNMTCVLLARNLPPTHIPGINIPPTLLTANSRGLQNSSSASAAIDPATFFFKHYYYGISYGAVDDPRHAEVNNDFYSCNTRMSTNPALHTNFTSIHNGHISREEFYMVMGCYFYNNGHDI